MLPENERRIVERLNRLDKHVACLWTAAIILAVFCAVAVFASLVHAQPIDLSKIPRTMRPDAAVAVALVDAQAVAAVEPIAARSCRYVMFQTATPGNIPALAYAANMVLNHAGDSYRPVGLLDSSIVRLDFASYSNLDLELFALLVDTWDRIQDSQFYLLTDARRTVRTPRYTDPKSGKVFESVTVQVQIPNATANINGQLDALCELTGCQVPIVSIGQALRAMLNTARQDGDFNNPIADFGLEYEFRNVEFSPRKGTAEEAFLLRAGVDLKDFGERNADQRVVLRRTPVPNLGIIEYLFTGATKPSVGPSIVTITRDYFAGPVQAEKAAIENLGDRKHDGTEILSPRATGAIEQGLFNAKGVLVREAPPQLASDYHMPVGALPRLQGIGSCVRCHVVHCNSKNSMYHDAPNYVTYLRNVSINGQRFDIFADRDRRTLQRLVSLYNGDTADAFALASQTHAKFAISATGWKLEAVAAEMLRLHDEWLYGHVTPAKMLAMLGYIVPDEQAVDVLNLLAPPAPEPLTITLLRAWKKADAAAFEPGADVKITIDDALRVLPELALRVQVTEQTLQVAAKAGNIQEQK